MVKLTDTLVRVYSIIGISKDGFESIAKKAIHEIKCNNIPVKILYTNIKDLKYKTFNYIITGKENGDAKFNLFLHDQITPDALYIMFSCPYEVDGIKNTLASRALERVSALFRLHAGNNFLKSLVFENIINPMNGDMKSGTPEIIIPNKCEGPFVNSDDWDSMRESIENLEKLPKNEKEIIERSLELFEEGFIFNNKYKFASIWISIEVLCGTHKPEKIYQMISKHYNESTSFAKNILFCQKIYSWRTKIFHHGENKLLFQSMERYMQCLYLDLFKFKTKSTFKGYMKSMLDENNFDPCVIDSFHINSIEIDLPGNL